MAVFISSKFSKGAACQYDGVTLNYGVNAFSSVAEAYAALDGIYDAVVFADSKVTLSAEEMAMLLNVSGIYGKAEVYKDEAGDEVYLKVLFANIKAANTLIIKDAPANDYTKYVEHLHNYEFNKVEVTNSIAGNISKSVYYTSKVSNEDKNGMVTETTAYKADGSVTVKNSSVGIIANYATVNLTNASTGAIICKQSYKAEDYGYWYSDDCDSYVDTYVEGGSSDIDYTAGGTLNIVLDKNAEKDAVYNIGEGDYWYGGEESYSYRTFGVIDGYNKVTITGLDGVKNPDNAAYIRVNGSIVGGNRDMDYYYGEYHLDYYYGEYHLDMESSGTVKISNGVDVYGAVAYFNSVTIASDSHTGAIVNGDGKVAVKYKFGKEEAEDYYESDFIFIYTMNVTETITLTGSVTVSDSEVGNITDYKTVKITNSDAGKIKLDTLTEQVVEYRSEYELDKDSENSNMPSQYGAYYTADGSLVVKIDKNADNDSYTIGKSTEDDGRGGFEGVYDGSDEYSLYSEMAENAAVLGYKKVDIAGYTDKKNSDNNKRVYVNGNIIGGDATSLYNNYEGTTNTVFTAGGSATLSNVSAGSIKGYTTVKLTDSDVSNVDKLTDKSVVKEKYETQKWSDGEGYDKYLVVTETFKKDGSLTANNSTVGDVTNYQTVNLLNSNAGRIERNTLASTETRYLVEEYQDGEYIDREYCSSVSEYQAAGSVTVKLDKNALSGSTVGDISGYANVTLTGYTDKKNSDNNKKVSAVNITGGNYEYEYFYEYEHEDEYIYDQIVTGSVKLDNASAENISGFKTVSLNNAESANITAVLCLDVNGNDRYIGSSEGDYSYKSGDTFYKCSYKTTYKLADKVTVAQSTVNGMIAGYGNVTCSGGSTVMGSIIAGDAYNYEYKEEAKERGEDFTYTAKETYTTTKKASVTLKNSSVGSEIVGFSKVALVNSNVSGGISQDGLTFTYEENDEESYSKLEYKATGSISITADKNAESSLYQTGSISGYEKVTISGYEGKDGKDVFITTGSIYGGVSIYESDEEYYDYMNPPTTEPAVRKTSGSVTLKNNVTVDGSICGYDKVTLTDVTVIGGIMAMEDYGSSENLPVGNSVILNGAGVEYISGYKNVSIAKDCNYVGDYYGSSDADTLTVAKGATLNIGNLSLGDGDKLVVKGTVVWAGGSWDVEAEQISGSGEIAASEASLDSIDLGSSSKVKLVNLGDTAEGFVSSASEAADNTEKKAVKWDGSEEYNGWLSGGGDGVLEDTVDYIKLAAQNDGTLSFSAAFGESDKLWINGKKWDGSNYNISAGTTYTIKLERNEGNSISYELSLA
ncbi:MAG: hypothetical protein E7039_07190 [Lentisphaerae bacterium]|nr:hypothetical protein [Lentisphaerota bacterium]